MPSPRLLIATWAAVVVLSIVVVATWDLQYVDGNCAPVLTEGSQDRFDFYGTGLRIAQWAWAAITGALILRGRARDVGTPALWRMAFAAAAMATVVVFSGLLLAREELGVALGVILLGPVALVLAAGTYAVLLARRERGEGTRASVLTWLVLCVLAAPLGLGILTVSNEGTFC